MRLVYLLHCTLALVSGYVLRLSLQLRYCTCREGSGEGGGEGGRGGREGKGGDVKNREQGVWTTYSPRPWRSESRVQSHRRWPGPAQGEGGARRPASWLDSSSDAPHPCAADSS